MDKSTAILHTAVCNAVAILNVSPEIVSLNSGRKVHGILRACLVEFADVYMDEIPTNKEVSSIHRKHRHD